MTRQHGKFTEISRALQAAGLEAPCAKMENSDFASLPVGERLRPPRPRGITGNAVYAHFGIRFFLVRVVRDSKNCYGVVRHRRAIIIIYFTNNQGQYTNDRSAPARPLFGADIKLSAMREHGHFLEHFRGGRKIRCQHNSPTASMLAPVRRKD